MGRPKHSVYQQIFGVVMKIRIDVLPDDVSLGGDLKHPAKHPFGYEGITVRHSTGARNVRTEKIIRRIILVLPNDLI